MALENLDCSADDFKKSFLNLGDKDSFDFLKVKIEGKHKKHLFFPCPGQQPFYPCLAIVSAKF